MKQLEKRLNDTYCLPTFLVIGSQRCASTYLQRTLELHPEITLVPKERRFFSNKIRTESINSYSQLFIETANKNKEGLTSVKGEIDPSYAVLRLGEIAIVKQLIPDLKIILIVRNPLERLISNIGRGWRFHYIDGGNAASRNIFALLRKVDNNLSYRFTDYYQIYKNWVYFYGEENILIETYDNIKSNPQYVLEKCCSFLEVSSQITRIIPHNLLNKKQNASSLSYESEIPHILKWYLAKKWLPKVHELQVKLDLDCSSWINSMDNYSKQGKLYYYIIIIIHYIYFLIPYWILHRVYNAIRIPLKIYQIRKNINSQIANID